ncbi:hypothetical protein OXX69_008823 [Metschnikowia pulcherrima]
MKLTTLAFSLSTVAIATAAGIEIGDNQNIKGDVTAGPNDNIKIGESNNAADTANSNAAKIDEALVSGDKPAGSALGAPGNVGAPAGSALGAAGNDVGAPAGPALGAADDALISGDGASKDAPKDAPKDVSKDADKAGPAAAGAQEVALVVKDASGANVEGTLELQKMEGGASVIYVKKEGEARKFDLKDGVASVKAEGNVSVVGQVEAHGGAAVLAAGKSDAHAVVEQKLEFNAQGKVTNLQFYVSAQLTVGISLNGSIPEDCKPIEIYKQASPNAKAPVSAKAPGASSNSSMSTVTDWVTYCPEATTITMTTCVQETCKPTSITVTGETTVTITGECLVEATAAVAAKASGGVTGPANGNAGGKGGDSSPAKGGDAGKAAPASKTPESAPASAPKASAASAPKASAPAAAAGAKTNQTASVSAFNGAAKNAAGVVGAVGVLAFLM